MITKTDRVIIMAFTTFLFSIPLFFIFFVYPHIIKDIELFEVNQLKEEQERLDKNIEKPQKYLINIRKSDDYTESLYADEYAINGDCIEIKKAYEYDYYNNVMSSDDKVYCGYSYLIRVRK